ncbi:hypothetical protein V6N12_042420 [Hibiscus sabdariffa]|uniref:Uncharacterized protein n=1 Tax=Hibiscus sabdariffa TaxID=183260 RepID=A0ABR2EGA1_9ROSI
MKDWIKLCRSGEVDCNSVGSVMHCFDNCLDRMTKGMPQRRQRVLPGWVSWRVLDIFYLGGKSPASAGNSAALAGILLGGKFCYRQENLHDSAQIFHGGKSPASQCRRKIACPRCRQNRLPGLVNLLWQEICLILLNSAVAGSPTLPRQMS